MATEVGREDEDEGYYGPPDYLLHSPGGSDSSQDADEVFIRQMQIARGSVSTKMVASKITLRSLQSVELEELPEADRSEKSLAFELKWRLIISRLRYLLQ
jgi:hypothetical protein